MSAKPSYQGTLPSYIIGFISSIVLTLAAYFAVTHHLFTGRKLVWVIVALGFIQTLVQLFFFLHLGKEQRPRWGLLVFLFMLLVLLILILGSVWIMFNLDERTM